MEEKYTHKLYCIDEKIDPADNIYFSVSFPSDAELYSDKAFCKNVNILEPKLQYFDHKFSEIKTVKPGEFKEYPICAHITFEKEENEKTKFALEINYLESGSPYLDAKLTGQLERIEREALNKRWEGDRKVSLEKVIRRLIYLGSARDGNILLNGGATISEDLSKICAIISPEYGMGKTSALLYLLSKGHALISNNLRIRINKDKICFYPQHYPEKETFIKVREENYKFLKDKLNSKIVTLVEQPSRPIGPNEALLKVETYPEKIEIEPAEGKVLYFLIPKPASSAQTPHQNPHSFTPDSSIRNLYSAWEIKWALRPAYGSFNLENGDARHATEKLDEFRNKYTQTEQQLEFLKKTSKFLEFEIEPELKSLDSILFKNGQIKLAI